ncbi:MAG: DUF1834 family protein [Nitrospirae bacterium]|nr:MAG: DUF1834 family protein [Nitrospirota bacterium]
MGYDIKTIEDAILAALKAEPLLTSAKTIDTYHGEIEDFIQQIPQLTIPLPAVLVHYTGSVYEAVSIEEYDETPTFTLILIAQDRRGKAKLRTGIYDLLTACKSILRGNNLGLQIGKLKPVRTYIITTTKTISAYGFDLSTYFADA